MVCKFKRSSTSKATEGMPSAPLLPVEDELGVAAGVEHADEAPGAPNIVLLDLCSPSLARLPHSQRFSFLPAAL